MTEKRPKIWAGIICYNNGDYIRATLESIKFLVDGVIIVDGRFKTYPGTYDDSSDDTLGEIFRFRALHGFRNGREDWKPLEIISIPCKEGGWDTQVEKRNAYLEHEKIKPGDWVFVIDGDEILICRNPEDTYKELEEHYDRGRALVQITNYSDRFRFFVKKEGMKYEGYHWKILDPETGENVNDLVDAAVHIYGKPLKSVEIAHMKWQRSQKVVDDKKLFYEARKPIEDPHVLKDMYDKALQLKEAGKLDEYTAPG